MMKHVTIKDIACSLCISVSTVSRALTDDKNIPQGDARDGGGRGKATRLQAQSGGDEPEDGAHEHHRCHRTGDAHPLCFAGD